MTSALRGEGVTSKENEGRLCEFYIVQGDQAACPKPPNDIDVKVAF